LFTNRVHDALDVVRGIVDGPGEDKLGAQGLTEPYGVGEPR
jgi:hypothetical protein